MQLYAVVVSHHTAPLPVRERLALPRERQQEYLAWWGQEVPEVALLVTCHRAEVSWIDREGSTTRGLSWLAKVAGMDEKDLSASALSPERSSGSSSLPCCCRSRFAGGG